MSLPNSYKQSENWQKCCLAKPRGGVTLSGFSKKLENFRNSRFKMTFWEKITLNEDGF